MDKTNEPEYIVLSNGGPNGLWKVEYRNCGNRFAAQRQADADKKAYGGEWIVAIA